MVVNLSEYQKKKAAQNIIEKLNLQEDHNVLSKKLDALYDDPSIAVAETISKSELETMITDIKNGTATNNAISSFLEVAEKFCI
ncbi:MAG: hypothetical protein HRT69_13690 [Flavobacteriaceae bacterium]|nr:hypothetical protein [Flavobacteriaceae bacterium]